jgi:hypothetical protein
LADEAQAQHDAAQAAHHRAVQNLESRKAELASFDELEASVTAHTVEALRDTGRSTDLPPDLRERISAREAARAALFAATVAEQVLQDDVAQTRDRLAVRNKAVDAAMLPVLALPAEGIAAEIHEHDAESKRLRAKLLGFDRICADHPAAMPGAVRDLLFNSRQVGSPQQLAPWQAAAAKLRADPDAIVEIEDPGPPSPPAPSPIRQVAVVAAAFERRRVHEAEAQAAREAEAAAPQTEGTDETKPPEAA